tara:strand:+ start:145 stop:471 length:327 start_codon:yes stop_codon:yes gene_type:complete
MLRTKIIISITIFSILVIATSALKTQTRIIEKEITNHQKKITNLQNNFYELQLDFYYLTSPDILAKRIDNFSSGEYIEMDFSRIYLDLGHFIKEQVKSTKNFDYEKKK